MSQTEENFPEIGIKQWSPIEDPTSREIYGTYTGYLLELPYKGPAVSEKQAVENRLLANICMNDGIAEGSLVSLSNASEIFSFDENIIADQMREEGQIPGIDEMHDVVTVRLNGLETIQGYFSGFNIGPSPYTVYEDQGFPAYYSLGIVLNDILLQEPLVRPNFEIQDLVPESEYELEEYRVELGDELQSFLGKWHVVLGPDSLIGTVQD